MAAVRNGYALALELGQSTLRGGLVDAEGRVIGPVERPSPLHADPGGLLDVIGRIVTELRDRAVEQGRSVMALGFSSTIDLDPRAGRFRVIAHPHLLRWRGFDIRTYLSERTGLPAVVENDGVAAAWGEYRAGAGVGAASMVCITLGTGIGGGVVLDGDRHAGSLGSASYFGHMTIRFDGPPCPCGQRGCWELFASAEALRRRAEAELTGVLGMAPSARDVVQAARNGNEEALRIVGDIGRAVGIGLASLANIFAPEVIVVGGGLAQAGDLLLEPARREMDDRRMRLREVVRLTRAELGVHSGVVGVGLLALEAAAGVAP